MYSRANLKGTGKKTPGGPVSKRDLRAFDRPGPDLTLWCHDDERETTLAVRQSEGQKAGICKRVLHRETL